MKRKASTLLEVLMALFLLSIMSINLLPGIASGIQLQTKATWDIETRLTAQTIVERLKSNHLNHANLPLTAEGYAIEIKESQVKTGLYRYDLKVQKEEGKTKAYELAIILPKE